MTNYYLEFDNAVDVAHWEEWAGREYAAANSVAYPIPPDNWPGPGAPPDSLMTYFYLRAEPKASGGGVVRLDPDIFDFATTTVRQLTDSTQYSFDLPANKKTREQLSTEARAIIDDGLPP